MEELRDRVERFVREHELIPPGGDVTCLVSGGADSTCLWHVLGALAYRVSALHVNHKLRDADSEDDARFCAELLGAEVVELDGSGLSEAALREQRRSVGRDRLRATGHTASDQVETILYRLVSRGTATGIASRSDDGVVHPLLPLWREETKAYCREVGLDYRSDASNAGTKRGLIREEILPLLRRLHPAADENLLHSLDTRETLPPALAELLAAPVGSKRVDLGGGLQAVREHERLWLERGPVELAGEIGWGEWTIRSELRGLRVRGWRPGDRLAGRRRKIQDVFVDAKVPRSEREAWPLVVRGDEVVAVPGIVEHPEVECVRRLDGARDPEVPALPAPEERIVRG
ncbi:MAG TPA: tRNA lysidine(34) synthetase TilS [Gaiellaceae bacterium]|nr:tRNA lysidine(34) synthetase TilS [Gaiellaceae bacterium]